MVPKPNWFKKKYYSYFSQFYTTSFVWDRNFLSYNCTVGVSSKKFTFFFSNVNVQTKLIFCVHLKYFHNRILLRRALRIAVQYLCWYKNPLDWLNQFVNALFYICWATLLPLPVDRHSVMWVRNERLHIIKCAWKNFSQDTNCNERVFFTFGWLHGRHVVV